tara:strand:- start:2210 stop:2716 length:507 start_codon:yes stop_codon:yes gene_type:complete
MTNLITIQNIDDEIKRTNINIDALFITYNIFLKTLADNNDIGYCFDTKIKLAESEINAIQNSINYNSTGIHNNMILYSNLKESKNNLDILNTLQKEQLNLVNIYDNHVYNTNLKIQLLTEYIEDLKKMRDRIYRWNNIENLTESEKEIEIFTNKELFNMQLTNIINNI